MGESEEDGLWAELAALGSAETHTGLRESADLARLAKRTEALVAAVVPAQALVPVGAASGIIVLEDKRRLLIDHLSRCIDGGVHVCHQS